jgi:uncharacterized protein (DUF433 family)
MPTSNSLENVIEIDPEKMHGAPVFRGTRVPIQNLFDYVEGGDSVERFLDHFPTVSRSQVIAVLELSRSKVLDEFEVVA